MTRSGGATQALSTPRSRGHYETKSKMRVSEIVERVALEQPLESLERAVLLLLLDLRFTGLQNLDQVVVHAPGGDCTTSGMPVINCTKQRQCTLSFPPLEPDWSVNLDADDDNSGDDDEDDEEEDNEDDTADGDNTDKDTYGEDDDSDTDEEDGDGTDSDEEGDKGDCRPAVRSIPLRDVRLPIVRVPLLPDTSASIIAAGSYNIPRCAFTRALKLVRERVKDKSATASLQALRRVLEREPVQ